MFNNSGNSLTLQPGVVVQFDTGVGLTVPGNATLDAQGTDNQPITLTGQTNQPGSWGGVNVQQGATARFAHCEVAFGGANGVPLINFNVSLDPNAPAPELPIGLHDCQIHDGAGDGISISISGSSPLPIKFVSNQIYSNAFGLRNLTPVTVVDARGNWWGDPSGPQAPSNPNGKGNSVSDGVLFDPWLLSPTSATPAYVTPNHGGDTGPVTVFIHGSGFQQSATVKLVMSGQPDIIGNPVTVSADGRTITTTFDLTGKAHGAWDLVVTTLSTSITLSLPFTIEAGQAPDMWVYILGRTILAGRPQAFTILVSNRGNVDAFGILVEISIPKVASFELESEEIGFLGTPVWETDQAKILPIYVSEVPANSFVAITMKLTFPVTTNFHAFQMQASWMTNSFIPVTTDPTAQIVPEILSITDDSLDVVLHVSSASDSTDIFMSLTLADTDTESVPTGDLSDFSGAAEFTLEASVEASTISTGTSSRQVTANSSTFKKVVVRIYKMVTKAGKVIDKINDFIDKIRKILSENKKAGNLGNHSIDIDKMIEWLLQAGCISGGDAKDLSKNSWVATSSGFVGVGTGIVDDAGKGNAASKAGHVGAGVVQETYNNNFLEALQKIAKARILEDYNKNIWGTGKCTTEDANSVDSLNPGKFFETVREKYMCTCMNPSGTKSQSEGVDSKQVTAASMSCPINTGEATFNGNVVGNADPNDKVGSQGTGTQHYISGVGALPYSIFFSNLETATAPAQEVVITDQLDVSKVDLNGFSFGPIAFGDHQVVPPPGLSDYTTNVDLRPGKNLIVRINAHLDLKTGLLTWHFTSIDPATNQLTTDPLGGFLPPDKNPPEGEGSVLYTIQPKQGLVTGTKIKNKARIVFDANAPIDTPEWLNTIDNTKPTSKVLSLPATENSANFAVKWSGKDQGAGILDYAVFVSDNGGAFTPWQFNTTDTSATFTGQNGHKYSFFSQARDAAGNVEDAKTIAEATTQVTIDADLSVTKSASPNPVNAGQQLTYTINVTNNGLADATGVTLTDTLPENVNFVSATFDSQNCETAGATATQNKVRFYAETLGSKAMQVQIFDLTDRSIYQSPWTLGSTLDWPLVTNEGQRLANGVYFYVLKTKDTQGKEQRWMHKLIVNNNLVTAESEVKVTCNIGNLANGATATVTIVVTPTAAARTITNTATVKGNENDPKPNNNTATASTNVIVQSDMQITQQVSPNPVSAGQPLTYSLTVTNLGPDNATGVSVIDTLPAQVQFVSVSPQGACSFDSASHRVNCSLGNVAVGAQFPISIRVIAPDNLGQLGNAALVTSETPDPNLANNLTTQGGNSTVVVAPLLDLIQADQNQALTLLQGSMVLTGLQNAAKALKNKKPNTAGALSLLTAARDGVSHAQALVSQMKGLRDLIELVLGQAQLGKFAKKISQQLSKAQSAISAAATQLTACAGQIASAVDLLNKHDPSLLKGALDDTKFAIQSCQQAVKSLKAVQSAMNSVRQQAVKAGVPLMEDVFVEPTVEVEQGQTTLHWAGTGELELFDLSGKRVLALKSNGSHEMKLPLMTKKGEPLANGVYLYLVSVRDKDGKLVRSEVKKLIISR